MAPTPTVPPSAATVTAPTISGQPANQTVAAGQTATFSVTAAGTAPLNYQWQKGTTAISGATASSYTTPATTTSDSGSQFSVVVSNTAGTATSNTAMLTVKAALTDVLTQHNDIARTGQNLTETVLTPANVNSATFGKIAFYPWTVWWTPNRSTLRMLPFRIMARTIYSSFPPSTIQSLPSTRIPVRPSGRFRRLKSGETTSDTRSCGQVTPEIGVTSTPVIDRTQGANGAIYLVAMSKDGSGNYHQRLHALDLALGAELFGGPVDIQATYPGTGDSSNGTSVIFLPGQYKERAALLLLNGVIYTSWASHCDIQPYTGWIMGYNESTLAQTTVLNVTPNGSDGAIWMAGAGLASDSSGNIYFPDANGDFDTTLEFQWFPQQWRLRQCLDETFNLWRPCRCRLF